MIIIKGSLLIINFSQKRMFLRHVHNFRGLAMLFIVLSHSLIGANADLTINHILLVFAQNSTVYFLIIAGFLFQHLLRKYEFKKYLKTKFKFIILPYLIATVVPIISIYLYHHMNLIEGLPEKVQEVILSFGKWKSNKADYAFYNHSSIYAIFLIVINGWCIYPFWFMPTIAVFYFLTPGLKYMDNNPKLYYLLIPLVAVSLIIGRGTNEIPILVAHFLPYFIFGMFLSHYSERMTAIFNKYYIPLSLLAVSFSVSFYITGFNQFAILDKLIYSLLILKIFLKYDNPVANKFFDLIAQYSFGIYFLHMVMKTFILKVPFLSFLVSELYIGIIIEFILTVALSIGGVKLIKYITRSYSRYIIGC